MASRRLLAGMTALAVMALGDAGCGSEHGDPPAAPTGVLAAPGNGQASLSWTASAGADGYRIYYSASGTVTSSSPRISVGNVTTAVVPTLPNGVRHTFAVSAVNGSGESPLSARACAVPTAADTTGLTLYDALCGDALDGGKWLQPGANASGVSGGAAVLSVDMSNEEARTVQNNVYGATVSVNAGLDRVTTLRADVTVPRATASRSGSGQIRALVRLMYSPPSNRLVFPGGTLDLLVADVGLMDSGGGLQAYRQVAHCDDATCSELTASNVAFADPQGFTSLGGAGLPFGAPAAYDTTYSVEVSLDETSGIFHWTISGGTFGAGVSGTADPSAYLAATPGWSGTSIAGAGFQAAQLTARTFDDGTGGASGRITGRFDDVAVGLNGAPAAAYDDFSGSPGNSGPVELSPAKWNNAGASSVTPSGGSLAIHAQLTSTTSSAPSIAPGLSISGPLAFNTIQVDVTAAGSVTGTASANTLVQGRFFNDGTPGGAPYSALGDVLAGVHLWPTTNTVTYMIGRCANATCSGAVSPILTGTFPGVSVTGNVHTVRVTWDPVLRRFTFRVDGQVLVVDPTTTFTVAGPPHAPYRRLVSSLSTPGISTASTDSKFNNVFVAP